MDQAVRADALDVSEKLAIRSKLLGELAHKGELVITPACYSLDTGKVEFIERPQVGLGARHPGAAAPGGQ
jgi:hypothetical protein